MAFFTKKKLLLVGGLAVLLVGSQAAQAAEATLKAVSVQFKIFVSGKEVKLDKDPVVIDGSTYLPVRALSDALGQYVKWDDASKTISLSSFPAISNEFTLKNPESIGKVYKEGGFSSLLHLPSDPDNVFYALADRGPNGDLTVDGKAGKAFPLPDFEVRFFKIELVAGDIKILETIKLQLPDGKIDAVTKKSTITGLPNIKGDEVAFNEDGTPLSTYDPDGLDLEGISYNPKDDTFWMSEEYSPSLVHVKRDGTIIARYVPKGVKEKLVNAQTPIFDTLPAIYYKHVSNRGFEGVSISPDGSSLFVAIQSPMAVPDKKAGDTSRQLRILKMDLNTQAVVGEYAYTAEDATQYPKVAQKDLVISELSALSNQVVLVDERDKLAGAEAQIKRIYRADFTNATNLLGTEVSDTLESLTMDAMKEKKINSAEKTLVVDMAKLGYKYEKLEGMTVVGKRQIVVVNDNDYDVSYVDGKLVLTDVPTQALTIELAADLK
ncbi:esterase-like activity of phytase family protein [Paenibacillus psychroresistens]|uniref:Esterase-like activity of phytase family protein n=1 Tax=Paenibacillus psychroresistens TaxID=1778678 RepID=A0A6B8RIB2_9BACL|nr:esterase-like activity of phytase family protein [Paenibacillus psychroresistens]QGQ95990.1 esterase-like activity of phytase family protein [Paenibacillus psychroresistens]